jgi:hypothetical protein
MPRRSDARAARRAQSLFAHAPRDPLTEKRKGLADWRNEAIAPYDTEDGGTEYLRFGQNEFEFSNENNEPEKPPPIWQAGNPRAPPFLVPEDGSD